MKTKVQVKDLRKGDVLSSGARVMLAPFAGLETERGKVEIQVEYPDGKSKFQGWNKNTTVTVINR